MLICNCNLKYLLTGGCHNFKYQHKQIYEEDVVGLSHKGNSQTQVSLHRDTWQDSEEAQAT